MVSLCQQANAASRCIPVFTVRCSTFANSKLCDWRRTWASWVGPHGTLGKARLALGKSCPVRSSSNKTLTVSCGGEDTVCKALVTSRDEVASASLVLGCIAGWAAGAAVGDASLSSSRCVTARSAPSCLHAGSLSGLMQGRRGLPGETSRWVWVAE